MELGDTTDRRKPFSPESPEPVRVYFRGYAFIWEAWKRFMPTAIPCEDIEKCKVVVFYSLTPPRTVGRKIAEKIQRVFDRDKREALVYEYDVLHKRFFARDQNWLDIPGRIVEDFDAS